MISGVEDQRDAVPNRSRLLKMIRKEMSSSLPSWSGRERTIIIIIIVIIIISQFHFHFDLIRFDSNFHFANTTDTFCLTYFSDDVGRFQITNCFHILCHWFVIVSFAEESVEKNILFDSFYCRFKKTHTDTNDQHIGGLYHWDLPSHTGLTVPNFKKKESFSYKIVSIEFYWIFMIFHYF